MLEALGTTLDEGEAMVADSVEFLSDAGMEVLFDAEHFFDGYKRNPEFALRTLEGGRDEGRVAPRALRHQRRRAAARGRAHRAARWSTYLGGDVAVAVHLHDDGGTGVANAIAGVLGGATQVQGTINGYGERTGNCNLTTIIPNLSLKMGIETIPADRMERLTPVAHHVAELVNMPLNPQAAYVGHSAFAHKAGLHMSAIAKRPDAYEHLSPDVGRQRHALRRVGAGGQVDARAQGEGARPRARRPAARRGGRAAEAARARGLPLRGRRRVARAA